MVVPLPVAGKLAKWERQRSLTKKQQSAKAAYERVPLASHEPEAPPLDSSRSED
jgi:hypothetical protein